jgi:phage shock protein PspC (stress-responsive transcriptional regulator)
VSNIDRHRPGGFHLDRTDGKVFGVCSGLANYWGVDANIIRLVFVAGTLFGFGSFILIYLVIALLAK